MVFGNGKTGSNPTTDGGFDSCFTRLIHGDVSSRIMERVAELPGLVNKHSY